MGVYIKGMEMPSGCASCDFANYLRDGEPYCRRLMRRVPVARRLPDCPLVLVLPHGRLIDADALVNDMANMIPWAIDSPEEIAMMDGLSAGYEAVKAAPTIIPAEEGE